MPLLQGQICPERGYKTHLLFFKPTLFLQKERLPSETYLSKFCQNEIWRVESLHCLWQRVENLYSCMTKNQIWSICQMSRNLWNCTEFCSISQNQNEITTVVAPKAGILCVWKLLCHNWYFFAQHVPLCQSFNTCNYITKKLTNRTFLQIIFLSVSNFFRVVSWGKFKQKNIFVPANSRRKQQT